MPKDVIGVPVLELLWQWPIGHWHSMWLGLL